MAASLLDLLRTAVIPLPAQTPPTPPGLRAAAVLLLVDSRDASLPVFFVLRSDRVKQHPGQIALPGGGVESGEDVATAALREAHEEVGLPPQSVEVLGQLPTFNTEVSLRWLTPVVGLIRSDWEVRTDGYEVAEWFWTPLADIVAAPHTIRELERDGRSRQVHFFEVGDRLIWGVTGWILAQLLRRMDVGSSL